MRFLLVDDNQDDALLIRDLLERGDNGAPRLDHALSQAEAETLDLAAYDLLLVDYRLQNGDGLSLYEALRKRGLAAPAVLLTGYGSEDVAARAFRQGFADYLSKDGLDETVLRASIRHSVALARVERQRKKAEHELRKERAFVADILRNSFDGIAVVDTAGEVLFLSPGMERIFGIEAQRIATMQQAIAQMAPKERREDLDCDLAELVAGTDLPQERTIPFRHFQSGESRWCRLQFSRMSSGNVVVNGQDVTEQVEAKKRLEHLALHDHLTGLPSRRLLLDRLEQAMRRSRREKGKVGVIYADLDGFKLINDVYGHDVGDAVLTEAARRLEECLRESDTVGRLGGDEFVVVAPNTGENGAVEALMARIRSAFAPGFEVEGQLIEVGLSLGASLYPDHARTPAELVKAADIEMYHDKKSDPL